MNRESHHQEQRHLSLFRSLSANDAENSPTADRASASAHRRNHLRSSDAVAATPTTTVTTDRCHGTSSSIGPYDVITGRSKDAFNNIGNRRFRYTVAIALERYLKAATRQGKTNVIISVVKQVQQNGGRFFKRGRDGSWIELDKKLTREKVGHALRDMATARESRDPTAFIKRHLNYPELPSFKPTSEETKSRTAVRTAKFPSTEEVEATSGKAKNGGSSSKTTSKPGKTTEAESRLTENDSRRGSFSSLVSNSSIGFLEDYLTDDDEEQNVKRDSEQNMFLELFESNLELAEPLVPRRHSRLSSPGGWSI